MKFVYILEMMVQTIDGIVNEPIGVFTSEEDADKWMKECQDTFKSDTVIFSILPQELDAKPPLLEMTQTVHDSSVGHQLLELYNKDVFEQMIESDGSFSYQLKPKYQNCLEKYIARRIDRGK
jgi:hypothetical protein